MKRAANLLATLGFLAATTLPSCAFLQETAPAETTCPESAQAGKITEANSILRQLPEQIPGAREVRKYETPGQNTCWFIY